MHYKALWPLEKRSRRGFRGYPIATVAFYGPDDQHATKVAVGIVRAAGAGADPVERWTSVESDVRLDGAVAKEIGDFVETQGVKSVVVVDRIIGCPHEEGTDYPTAGVCPQCPFWVNRDRWSGQPSR